ncbi:hypothetical protein THRCLA_04613, partial [Thraustotheca clavata]
MICNEQWTRFSTELIAGKASSALLLEIFQALPSHGFGVCKAALVEMLKSNGITCALLIVELLLEFWSNTSVPLAYLLLMVLEESCLPLDRLYEMLEMSVQLQLDQVLLQALNLELVVDAKVVTKCIQLFKMHQVSEEIVKKYALYLVEKHEYTSLLKLIQEFPLFAWKYEQFLETLVASNSWSMAEQLIKIIIENCHEKEYCAYTKKLVEMTLKKHDLKKAHKFVLLYNLQEIFPDVEGWFRREALEKLCIQKKWSIASTFVGTDVGLQATLYQYVAMSGNSQLADELYTRFQLDVLRIEATEDSCDGEFLSWELPLDQIVLCDTKESMDSLESYDLHTPLWIGLDVEWRPIASKDEICLASLLQIACGSQAFLVDLIALEKFSSGFDILKRILLSPSIIKVGFGFSHDLQGSVLKHTFPEKSTFDTVHGLVEIDTLLHHWQPSYAGRSLTDAATLILGKPLNKNQQLSDWEKRPLTSKQIEYAALDAWSLIAITSRICSSNPDLYLPCVESVSCKLSNEPIDSILRLRQARLHVKYSAEESKNQVADFIAFHSEVDVELVSRIDLEYHMNESSVQIANSLCILANGLPFVVVIAEHNKVDLSLLSMVLGTPRKKVRFARPTECISVFGYAPGTVPPFPHRVQAPVLIDSALQSSAKIALGGGAPDALLLASFDAIVALSYKSQILPLSAQHDNIKEPQELKFLADTMLGRVAKWLRMTGVDILHWEKCDDKSKMLVQATIEHRIVLTRDRKLAKQRQALACYVVLSDNVEAQFQEIKKHFKIEFKEETFMSRCAKCNSKGFRI